jgi:hypothetical protein
MEPSMSLHGCEITPFPPAYFLFVGFFMVKIDASLPAMYTKAQLARIQESVEVWKHAEPVDLMKRVSSTVSSASQQYALSPSKF